VKVPRVVFIGTSHLGLRCLEALLQSPALAVAGVVSAPETFRISYRPEGVRNVLYANVAGAAAAHGVPSMILGERMTEPALLDAVSGWSPDVMLVAGWYHMIPRAWRDLAPTYGLHASLLPKYAGGAPLVWALINDEPETGISLFQLGGGVDDGPVAGQRRTAITDTDNIGTVYARIEALAVELVREEFLSVACGTLKPRPQDVSQRTVVPQRSPADGWIDWSWSARRVFNFVRAQTRPYPGAFAGSEAGCVRLWAVSAQGVSAEPPGTVRMDDGVPLVTCGDGGLLRLDDWQLESSGGGTLIGVAAAQALAPVSTLRASRDREVVERR